MKRSKGSKRPAARKKATATLRGRTVSSTSKRRPFVAKTTAATRYAQLEKGYDALRKICNKQKRSLEALGSVGVEGLAALRHTALLASEYCIAVDNRENDIGGSRPVLAILQELGPACDVSDRYVGVPPVLIPPVPAASVEATATTDAQPVPEEIPPPAQAP